MAAKIMLGVADCSLSSGEDEEANWFCNKFGGVPVIYRNRFLMIFAITRISVIDNNIVLFSEWN